MQIPQYVNKPFKPPRRIDGTIDKSRRPLSQDANIKLNSVNTKQPVKKLKTIDNRNSLQNTKLYSKDTNTTTSNSQIISNKIVNQNIDCFMIMYRKRSNKKNKTWTDDGYATLSKEALKLTFLDITGKILGFITIINTNEDYLMDTIFKFSAWEIQLDYRITELDELNKFKDLLKNRTSTPPSTSSSITSSSSSSSSYSSLALPFMHQKKLNSRLENKVNQINSRLENKVNQKVDSNNDTTDFQDEYIPISQLFSKKTTTKFKPVIARSDILTPLSNSNSKRKYSPIFDVNKIKDPFIMNKSKDFEVDVIVDPILVNSLRDHQKIGIKFIYDCVMGLKQSQKSQHLLNSTNDTVDINDKDDDSNNGTTIADINESLLLKKDSDVSGCLLADDMGLGKTLMTITVIWTLLKQTPFPSKVDCSTSGVPLSGLIKKILIVCPVTLIGNWSNEFNKWLSPNKIGVLTLKNNNTLEMDKMTVKNFFRVQRTYQVLIVGYEKLLSISDELQMKPSSFNNGIDLLICDEGHRLKNSNSKILNILKSLDIKRKILLTGTPIQNDLTEFYTIVDFINPGILGNFPQFKKKFIIPITRARDTSNRYNEEIQELGEDRSMELIETTKRFTLRRTNEVLTKFLPPKTDIILFCKPTASQIKAFHDVLKQTHVDFQQMTVSSSLAIITLFKKVCNSPSLLTNDNYFQKIDKEQTAKKYFNAIDSGKLQVLKNLIQNIRQLSPNEKIVIVSNYTQTLDIIAHMLSSLRLISCRLDGSTQQKQRDSIVKSFNRSQAIFAFLLSAKAGGVGLNLIGASRLILFDNDWNPSVDLQAMSRIHRQGQNKPCFIYRLITTGCIDEKILQRQLMKHNLSKKFLDSSSTGSSQDSSNDNLFKKEDLKDLFTIQEDTTSNTHDLICSCEGNAEDPSYISDFTVDTTTSISKLGQWTSASQAQKILDEMEENEKKMTGKIIKECLQGFQHINPTKKIVTEDPVTSQSINEVDSPITFAFLKKS